MPRPRKRVVVTGYGLMSPLGPDVASTFAAAREGRSGVRRLRNFDPARLPCQIGGEVETAWLEERENPAHRRLGKFSTRGVRMARVAAAEAAAAARLGEIGDRSRLGVALGSHGEHPGTGDLLRLFPHWRPGGDGPWQGIWDFEGFARAGGYDFLGFYRRKVDVATSVLAVALDCQGPTASICSACAAGAQAVGEAVRLIRSGKADVMVAGGCESALSYVGFVGFVLLTALAEKYESPERASRPFDRKRNGFVMSEGAGALVLEELGHARARRAPVLGEVLGYGDSADAFRITDMHPKGAGAVLAMRGALRDAGVEPGQVEYINAHGTSTPKSDSTETMAIKEVFGGHAKRVPVSSNKSMLGHTIGAAGAIEAILTLEGMRRSEILPTINYENRDPKCDLDYVPNETRPAAHRIALSNSFGFGGQNACLCLGRFEDG
ncbi:MAG: beta-ketoacyl-[acyl-carrier-protein] synthase family protein [Candidatus Tectomicrobia bacterium]|nr:beta-ketoacyl-[acyl-carrier-protein] synthase family protein [Candidatus Tectomicrobia bacterium]